MTDIVERLRADAEFSQYMADIRKIEIERLQAAGRDLLHAIGHDRKELIDEAVDKMRRALENKPMSPCTECAEYQEAVVEIERLQAHAKSMVDAMNVDIDAKTAEIERLRGIEQFSSEASRHERDGLRADNERLRAALQPVAKMYVGTGWDGLDKAIEVARRALEPKP